MSHLNLTLGYQPTTTEISNSFIDNYMTTCPPVYSLIYIFALKKLYSSEPLSTADLAGQFNITESDVKNAWKHWENVGLVKLDADLSITFLQSAPPQLRKEKPTKNLIIGSRPQYTVEELAAYRTHSSDIAHLFDLATKTMGKLLCANDMSIIFGFHDWLRLPIDVIEYLFEYCAQNGHRSMRYIEKCALDWADNDIDSTDRAVEYVQIFDKNYRTILQYMGQSGYPIASHRKFIDVWLDDWQMPLDLVMEACDRTVANIGKPQFKYMNTILQDWHKKGIKDIPGVKQADEEHAKEQSQIVPISMGKSMTKPKANGFVNFPQREYDYAQLEKLERAYLQGGLR